MRIGPGGGGSSSLRRVSVLESRIDPAQGLVARKRGDDRPELRATVATGQCEAHGAQVAADGLQLLDERAGVEAVALPQLAKALERRPRALGHAGRHRFE